MNPPEAIQRAARVRAAADTIIRRCEGLQEHLRRAVPGIDGWNGHDGPLGDCWVGLGQAKAHAELLAAMSPDAIARLLLEKCP